VWGRAKNYVAHNRRIDDPFSKKTTLPLIHKGLDVANEPTINGKHASFWAAAFAHAEQAMKEAWDFLFPVSLSS
jgi:hypothetical protein